MKLKNDIEIPPIGLGVWKMKDGEEVESAVKTALETGYRLIDTAMIYGNEGGVGKAVNESGIPRKDIFITTKVWNKDQGYETTLKAIDESLGRLGMDYVDLYLVHWPSASDVWEGEPHVNKRKETWRAMEEIYRSGKAKAIGVSNYTIKHLEEMKDHATIFPVINQVEFHPFLYQKDLLEYCQQNQIVLEAYSPLARGKKTEDPRIQEIAEKYKKSNAQIMLRWSIQHNCIPIPKSSHPDRIQENFNVFDFEISPEVMGKIDSLNENLRMGRDPNTME